jgi:DNA-binding transcriptional LysR family regulator
MSLRIRQVEHFIRVVEQGSIGKAARMLNISQPALTKSLHQLERDINAVLLERSRSGVRPTVYGDCLYKHAKRVETELARATQEIEELRGTHRGIVTVGAIPAVARGFLPAVIVQLTHSRPGITVSVSELNNSELLASFSKGEFDFIVAILDQDELETGQVAKTLFYDELVVAVRPKHPLTKLAKVRPRDLLAHPWIYPRAGTARRKRIDDFFFASGLTPPVATVEGSSTSFKLAILLQSDLITVMPQGVLDSDESAKQLRAIRFKGPTLRRRIGIIHRGASNLSPASRALIGEIEAAAKVPVRTLADE